MELSGALQAKKSTKAKKTTEGLEKTIETLYMQRPKLNLSGYSCLLLGKFIAPKVRAMIEHLKRILRYPGQNQGPLNFVGWDF